MVIVFLVLENGPRVQEAQEDDQDALKYQRGLQNLKEGFIESIEAAEKSGQKKVESDEDGREDDVNLHCMVNVLHWAFL